MHIHANCPKCNKEVGKSYYSSSNLNGIRCWTCDENIQYLLNRQEQENEDALWRRLNAKYAKTPPTFMARVKRRLDEFWHMIKKDK